MSILGALFGKKREAAKPEPIHTGGKLVKEEFVVVGMPYHMDALKRIATANPEWRKGGKRLAADGRVLERIWHYTYLNKPVRIEHEADNERSANAMKVLIAGEHIGYISEETAAHARAIIETTSVKYISATISGGECKVVSQNGDEVKSDEPFRVRVRIGYAAP